MRHIYKLVLTLCIMMVFVISPGEPLVRAADDQPAHLPAVKSLPKMVVKGKIKNMSIMGGYYIASRGEVYKIANQNPQVLQELTESGRIVIIEARSQGDLLTIETIDGQSYVGGQAPTSK